jgi:hypothetical protein
MVLGLLGSTVDGCVPLRSPAHCATHVSILPMSRLVVHLAMTDTRSHA